MELRLCFLSTQTPQGYYLELRLCFLSWSSASHNTTGLLRGAPPQLSVKRTPQGYYVELRLRFLSRQHHRVITWSSASAFCQDNTTGLLRGAPPPLSVKTTPQGGAPPPLCVKRTPQGYYVELRLRFLSRQHDRVITWSSASAFCKDNTTGLLRGAPHPLSVKTTRQGYYVELRLRFL